MAELLHESGIWLQAHRFTLTIIANALVELGGGVDAVLHAPRVVVFKLGPPRSYDGTPATAFTLEAMNFNHRDKFGGLTDPQWTPAMITTRKHAATAYQEAGVGSVLVGMLPVTIHLRDVWETSAQTSFPLCRPWLPEGEVVDERKKALLKNLTKMCAWAIEAGIVFHMPEDPTQVVPDMGNIVLQGKDWTWKRHERSDFVGSGDDGERGGLADWALSPTRPMECFVTYHRMWPYHSIPDAARQVLAVYPELEGRRLVGYASL